MAPVIDLVFSGGGTRGVALAGALDVLEQKRPVIKRLLGTSAGAIAAAFGAAGLSGADYLKLVPAKENDAFNFNSFFAPPPGQQVRESAAKKDSQTRMLLRGAVDGSIEGMMKGFAEKRPAIGTAVRAAFEANKDHLYESMFLGFLDRAAAKEDPKKPRSRTAIFALIEFGGLYDPSLFRTWLPEQLSKRLPLFDDKTTLKQFHELTRDLGRELSVVVTDTADARPLVLNHRTAPDCPVVEAVLMSLSVPLVWPETEWKKEWGPYLGKEIEGHLMLDGGLLANFPIHFLTNRDSEESQAIFGPKEPGKPPAIIGLLLDDSKAIPGDVQPALADKNEIKLVERINRMLGVLMACQEVHMKDADGLICHIPVKGHPALEMKPTPDAILRLQALVNSGRCAMMDHLKKRKLL